MVYSLKMVVWAGLVLSASATALAQDRGRDRTRAPTADPAGAPDRARVQDRDPSRAADQDRLRERDQDRVADRDRVRDDQTRDRDQIRQQLHVQDSDPLRTRDIYGSELMSREERRQYRERIQEMDSVGDWARYRAEHQARMTKRAREQGLDLPPPMFGQQLMTDQERERLGERMREATSEQERQRIAAEHREEMQARAREHRIPLSDLE